jgi:hypothetical protein
LLSFSRPPFDAPFDANELYNKLSRLIINGAAQNLRSSNPISASIIVNPAIKANIDEANKIGLGCALRASQGRLDSAVSLISCIVRTGKVIGRSYSRQVKRELYPPRSDAD